MSLQKPVRHLVEFLEGQEELPSLLVERSRELQERLLSGRLHLAVLGQFKRGKSSLINALLGAQVLPQGVLPLTLIPTFLSYGSQPGVRVTFEDGRMEDHPLTDIDGFVSELENPQNYKQVRQVDVIYPSSLLEKGVVLIDTPGIGSTHQHNTEASLNALPRFDAAVMVLSVDPPITAAEVEYLRQINRHVVHLFFVLNKIDYFERLSESNSPDLPGIAKAEQFLRHVLESESNIPQPRIFSVSALQGIEAQMQKDQACWEASGMAAFEEALLGLAQNNRTAILEQAIRRKAQNLAGEADYLLALRQQALWLPLSELEQRIEVFKEYAEAAQQKRLEIGDRLIGDEKRLSASLEESIEAIRQRVLPELEQLALETGVSARDSYKDETFQQAGGRIFDRERQVVHQQVIQELNSVLETRAVEAQAIREKLRQEASDLLDIPYSPLLPEDSQADLAEPAWVIEHLSMNLQSGFGELLMPGSLRMRREADRRHRLARELTVRNVEKIRWWLMRMIVESLGRFRARIGKEMEETIHQIDNALQTGRECHQSRIDQTSAIRMALEKSRTELHELSSALEQGEREPVS